jgi:hypothetical protein
MQLNPMARIVPTRSPDLPKGETRSIVQFG